MISRKSAPHVQSTGTGQGQGQDHHICSRLDLSPITSTASTGRELSPQQNTNNCISKNHKDNHYGDGEDKSMCGEIIRNSQRPSSALPPLTIPPSPSSLCHLSDGTLVSRDYTHTPLTFNAVNSFSPTSSSSPYPYTLSSPTHVSPRCSPPNSLLLPPTRSGSPHHLVTLTPPRLVSSC